MFCRDLGFDPFAADLHLLREAAAGHAGAAVAQWQRDELLDLLFSALIEPRLGQYTLQFVTGFPAARASLARLCTDAYGTAVADRFELYVNGIELANGYNELADPAELRRRMLSDNAARSATGRVPVPLDERLLAALAHGMPECAGVALGVDRLIMIALEATHIDQVVAFSAQRA